ncbi:hypothetical protein KSC_070940 [Ktedonobacter sp. SOSP1-52]|nr:hypothetical protein KSC_070940 [Ktedonobacter sp. SOSP1-52]
MENEQLFPSDSPFEFAQANMPYVAFLRQKTAWKTVIADTQATLEASQVVFWLQGTQWHLRALPGVAADYVTLFHLAPGSPSWLGRWDHVFDTIPLGIRQICGIDLVCFHIPSLSHLTGCPFSNQL